MQKKVEYYEVTHDKVFGETLKPFIPVDADAKVYGADISIVVDRAGEPAHVIEQKIMKAIARAKATDMIYIQLNIGSEIVGNQFIVCSDAPQSKVDYANRKVHLAIRDGKLLSGVHIHNVRGCVKI